MTALPPSYYLHVWWARRPLVAARAAILASLLPADADRERFLHALGYMVIRWLPNSVLSWPKSQGKILV